MKNAMKMIELKDKTIMQTNTSGEKSLSLYNCIMVDESLKALKDKRPLADLSGS